MADVDTQDTNEKFLLDGIDEIPDEKEETASDVLSLQSPIALSAPVPSGDGGEGALEHEDGLGMENEEDAELEAIKARVREMEEEAEKLKEMQNEVEKQMSMTSPVVSPVALPMSPEDKVDVDNRSIYIGNVDYSATAEELEAHFHGCGSINRVTILCNKFTGHPKGFAYIEFADKDSVSTAVALDDSLFKGRQIKVNPKRTNRPGISSTDRPPRGRGRGRGHRGYNPFFSGYTPRRRAGYRGRRFSRYSPY
ncbi:polyadenylate-binding protein 2-B-like [Antedon mediterranea]|uniref:polyadenylate-binding protein 2-B-like n=1 Tax=Antedon mediterranea TaxID=105859 RepID=UPI003AF5B18C